MTDIESLCVPGARSLKPYQPGKPIEELERELGITDIIKLASNENPLGMSASAQAAISAELADCTRYPDGSGFRLKNALAEQLEVEPGQITLGNGSSEILSLVARLFLGPEHNAVVSRHAFVVYALAVQAQNAELRVADAESYGHNLDAMAELVDENTRVVFIANPNNPTGTWLSAAEIEAFMNHIFEDIIVVIDEAYFEYVDADNYRSAVELLPRFPNLIVTRTFSKAYGLAGLRVGYGVSNPPLAELLNRVREPFNVNSAALAAAEAVLADAEYLGKSVAVNKAGLAQVAAGLKELGLDFIPSVGNFITFKTPVDAGIVYERLLHKGVIVRPVAAYELPNFLRVSIGLPAENQRFLESLAEVLKDCA